MTGGRIEVSGLRGAVAASWLIVAMASRALGAQATATSDLSPVPSRNYFVFVGSESVDRVALIRFGPKGAAVERERYVGWAPTELAGPHGVAVSPDKKH